MHPEAREELQIRFKKVVLDMAPISGVTKTCHEFRVARSTFMNGKPGTIVKGYPVSIGKDR